MQNLQANPKALGVFGFSVPDQDTDKIQGYKVNGVEPTFETIAAGVVRFEAWSRSNPSSRPSCFASFSA